ncbi:MAG: hypothetical protein WC325_08445 [Candidatus Bathyarchaeia archaeon]|jgi:hypothetical protein
MVNESIKQPLNLTWKAEYLDGKTVTSGYTTLERGKLVKFGLYNDDKTVIEFPLDNKKSLFYRLRVFKALNQKENSIHILGYRTVKSTVLYVVKSDGTLEKHNSFSEAAKQGTYDIQFFDFEAIK